MRLSGLAANNLGKLFRPTFQNLRCPPDDPASRFNGGA
jgi:hypothetical protein